MENKKLGFGCMRMPITELGNQTAFDYEKIESLFDVFLEKGFTYFDTAYTYHGYKAEEAVRTALVERHPRESFQLATKMPLRDFKDGEDLEKIFNEQLENGGVSYFDYYLLHNMGYNVYEKSCKYDAFGFVRKKKSDGYIKNIGMSFHDTPELLDEILGRFGEEIDFVQLQINYIDWRQQNVQAEKCLEVANKYNKPVIVMEPCKGGTLVNLPREAEEVLKEYNSKASNASWALRYAASQRGVIGVLSGMNSLEQVYDNTSTFTDFQPLNEEEMKVSDRVVEILNSKTAIGCTACEYCTHGCPKEIAIPQYFALYNSMMQTSGRFSSQAVYYNNIALGGHGKASDCIDCGKCEEACPQHLPIRKHLEDVKGKFEAGNSFPIRK